MVAAHADEVAALDRHTSTARAPTASTTCACSGARSGASSSLEVAAAAAILALDRHRRQPRADARACWVTWSTRAARWCAAARSAAGRSRGMRECSTSAAPIRCASRCRALVNCAGAARAAGGAGARHAARDACRRRTSRAATGSRSAGASPFRRLVYPMPEPGGLGIHVTLDLAGQARFGPDVSGSTASTTRSPPAARRHSAARSPLLPGHRGRANCSPRTGHPCQDCGPRRAGTGFPY